VPLARWAVLNAVDVDVQTHESPGEVLRHLTGKWRSSVEQTLGLIHVHFLITDVDSLSSIHQRGVSAVAPGEVRVGERVTAFMPGGELSEPVMLKELGQVLGQTITHVPRDPAELREMVPPAVRRVRQLRMSRHPATMQFHAMPGSGTVRVASPG
jgi:hypothetical protein